MTLLRLRDFQDFTINQYIQKFLKGLGKSNSEFNVVCEGIPLFPQPFSVEYPWYGFWNPDQNERLIQIFRTLIQTEDPSTIPASNIYLHSNGTKGEGVIPLILICLANIPILKLRYLLKVKTPSFPSYNNIWNNYNQFVNEIALVDFFTMDKDNKMTIPVPTRQYLELAMNLSPNIWSSLGGISLSISLLSSYLLNMYAQSWKEYRDSGPISSPNILFGNWKEYLKE